MTLNEVEAAVLTIDPAMDRDSEAFKASVALFASAIVGTNVERVAMFTGIPRSLVAKFGRNLRSNGIWRNGKIQADWLEEDGGAAFILDTLVAMGMLERSHD